MNETCKSCGTVFEVDESVLKNIKWFKCGVCNYKWDLFKDISKNSNQIKTEYTDKSDKVKHELASIKSVIEDKSKMLAKKTNPALDQKNKSVAEISSELSKSKLNETKQNESQKLKESYEKKNLKKQNFLPYFMISIILIFTTAIFLRSILISYSYLYFPNKSQSYIKKIDRFFTKIYLPILSETKHLNLKNFVATVQKQEVRFTGVIKNNSKRPVLTPRIRILGIREDRKIILENILILEEKIIPQTSEISFNKLVKFKTNNNKENIIIKATLLKKVFDY